MLVLAAVFDVDGEGWVRSHSPLLVWLLILLVAMLLVRVVVKRLTQTVALAVLSLLALGVWVQRTNIRECTESCSCDLLTVPVDVPFCRPGLEL